MARARIRRILARVRHEILESLTEEYTRHQVATSFAIGAFITMLPTLGIGLLVFLVLDYLFDWINKVALFANAIVFNPVVKWGIYAAGLLIGFALLGPVEGARITAVPSLQDSSDILIRLAVGHTILTIVVTIGAYVVADRLLAAYEAHQFPVVEETIDEFVHEAAARDTDAEIDR